MTLRHFVNTLVTSLGAPVSARRISNTLKSAEGITLSPNSVGSYLSALVESYFFVKAERFDIRGNRALSGLEKFYLTDPGMKSRLVETHLADLGHLLENVVYLELRRRHQKVLVGKVGDYEVDFIVRDSNQTFYVQVAMSVADEETLNREIRPFKNIPDKAPCYLLSLDRFGTGKSINGIQHLNAVDWLLDLKSPL